MVDLNKDYWDNKYNIEDTGWDIGYASPAIIHFMKKIKDKSVSILIPGCGNSYEGEELFKLGFTNITLMDFSQKAKDNFLKRVPDFPENQFLIGDFFELKGRFDIIIEQTFFCALNPDLREKYAKKINELLSEEGMYIGLLFDDPLNDDHPPFGGNKDEYIKYFEPYFSEITMEKCYNSIPQREGRELFVILIK